MSSGSPLTVLTKEQRETLTKLGQKVVPIKTQPPQPQKVVAKVDDPVVQENTQGQTIQSNNTQKMEKTQEREYSKTYLKLGDEVATLEFDLVSYREKGQESRYVSINFKGYDIRSDEQNPQPQEAFYSISSKDEFDKIKQFFANLNWED